MYDSLSGFVEYCSYKGLTPIHFESHHNQYRCSVEYCSYKGLTHKYNQNNLFLYHHVEYCSYKGLTLIS